MGSNPTTARTLTFALTFSEDVTGVDLDDFDLYCSALEASIASVTGSGSSYTVTVDVLAVNSTVGLLRLKLIDDDSIVDAAENPLGGTGAGNGNYNSGLCFIYNQ